MPYSSDPDGYYVIAWVKGNRSGTERVFGPFETRHEAYIEKRKRNAPGIQTRVAYKQGNVRRVY
jgi:hypothetical protein